MQKALKCSNCGKITERISVLPLCKKCLAGHEDYEKKYSKSIKNVQIELAKDAPKNTHDEFLKI